MNYENMSDFEINKLVAEKEGLLIEELDDGKSIGMTSDFHEKYPSTIWAAQVDCRGMQCESWGQINYCNSWADMGSIIHKSGISLTFKKDGSMCIASHDLQKDQHYTDLNPLRAAAIVYLMMEVK